MTVEKLYDEIVKRFSVANPNAATELRYDSPFHLLLAVILSAQCTDKRVNEITPALFDRFPTPESLAIADHDEVLSYIKSVSYPNNKTKSLIGAAQTLVEKFDSEIPSDIDSLLTIPGVGRKTANVMLSVVFNQAAMAVDTHVFRVSHRLGLVEDTDNTPDKVERRLTSHLPKDKIATAHHWLILHGRYVCQARRPDCLNCFLNDICRFYNNKQASHK